MACSSTPQVTELPNTADVEQELARVDGELSGAKDAQVNVLSPVNFDRAVETLRGAKEARSKNKDQTDILHRISLAQAYLDKASAVANVSNQLIPGVIRERKDAIVALAPAQFSEKFGEADSDLINLSKDIEANDTSGAEKVGGELQARYSDLELKSILKTKIGPARDAISQATKEGARKLTPQTLAWAEKKVNDDESNVANNRHDDALVNDASADSAMASTRLLNMVRQAKNSSEQSPEQLATQVESEQHAIGTAEANLNHSQAALASEKIDTAILVADNQQLSEKNKLEKQYEYARHQFTNEEAQVYKQGDKLVLRLRGLSFPKDQSVITTDNYPLLTKVQNVIKETDPGKIVIEGHTDSTGSKTQNDKLSTARADSVEGYLKANNFIDGGKITASGYGDSKPIATNKTKVGRAQNRRVDVILDSTKN